MWIFVAGRAGTHLGLARAEDPHFESAEAVKLRDDEGEGLASGQD